MTLPRRLRLSRGTFPKREVGGYKGTNLSLSVGPTHQGGCAVVVSKKVAKHAVDRHRIKRRIFQVVRPFCSPTRFIVVYAKNGCGALSFKELTKELTELLNKTT